MPDYELGTFNIGGLDIELYASPHLFEPNLITNRFGQGVKGVEGKTVFDIGTGVGPLAILAAKQGANKVIGVDPVQDQIELARLNIRHHSLEDIVEVHQGSLFGPLVGKKADIIIADVSGIAEKAGRALGWYPEKVPTGGPDGTEIIVPLIEQAGEYLEEGGVLYFGVAPNLSDQEKILEAAERNFESVVPLNPEPTRVPLTKEMLEQLDLAYSGSLPQFMVFVEHHKRKFWTAQFYKASNPKKIT